MTKETLPIIKWDQAYNRNGNSKLPRAVMNVIRTYMNNNSLSGYVKAETLASATGLTVRGVRKQIAANVEAGWLQIAEPGNSKRANVYKLTYPKGEPQFTVEESDTDSRVNHSSPLEGNREPQFTPKGEPQFTPTSPRTSPKEKFLTSSRTVNHSSPLGEPRITAQEAEDDGPSCGGHLAVEVETEETEGIRPEGLSALHASAANGSLDSGPNWDSFTNRIDPAGLWDYSSTEEKAVPFGPPEWD